MLSFLVKAYAKTEPLPEERGTWPAGADRERKKPPEHSENGSDYGNAYGSILYCHGNTPEYFCLLDRETVLGAAALPENPFQRKSIRGCAYSAFEEIFFLVYGKTVGITHNANNSTE